jgi:hypothetical protein
MTINIDELIAERVVEVMNSALTADPAAIYALTTAQVLCNKTLADHPTIQVMAEKGIYKVGMLGILNGLAGTQIYKGNPGWGRIAAIFDLNCPNHGHTEQFDGLKVGDECPDCGEKITLGVLKCFKLFKDI